MNQAPAAPALLASATMAQFRLLVAGLRLEAALVAGFIVVVSLTIATGYMQPDSTLDFAIVPVALMFAAGFALPWTLWKQTPAFGPTPFAAMPIGRHGHMIARMTAGWLWAMAALALVLAWVGLVALSTTGEIVLTDVRRLVSDPSAGPLARVAPWWSYVTPFAAVTVSYGLGTAWVLGLRRPAVWLIGSVVAALIGLELGPDDLVARALQWLGIGPVGLDHLVTGGLERLDVELTLPDGRRVIAWSGLPTFQDWILALLFWAAVTFSAVTVALLRPRDV
ncbi:hypothetical protein [Brevundimonas lutea]|uniref:hypothetical protein n=1 Tax=Brevundimonas lutea TaxID=2293980 RepID=UPI0013CE6F72|nr:hypothetical protein [Brevundimonas lutea]